MSSKEKARIVMGELIGRKTKVVKSKDPNKKGIKGKIVDETKETITIETENGEKKIPKKTSTFKFTENQKEIKVNGEEIRYRPEDRIKKNWRKYNDIMQR